MLVGDLLLCITLGVAPCSAPDPEGAAPTTLKECEPTACPGPLQPPLYRQGVNTQDPQGNTQTCQKMSWHKVPWKILPISVPESPPWPPLNLLHELGPLCCCQHTRNLRGQKIPAGDTKVLAGHWFIPSSPKPTAALPSLPLELQPPEIPVKALGDKVGSRGQQGMSPWAVGPVQSSEVWPTQGRAQPREGVSARIKV